jgi:hypothetical protein
MGALVTTSTVIVLVMLSLALVAFATPFAGRLVKRQKPPDDASQAGSASK